MTTRVDNPDAQLNKTLTSTLEQTERDRKSLSSELAQAQQDLREKDAEITNLLSKVLMRRRASPLLTQFG